MQIFNLYFFTLNCRFRVKVNALDSTFNCPVVLMDRVVIRLVGLTATKMYQDQSKVGI